jgi:hypothetical protein
MPQENDLDLEQLRLRGFQFQIGKPQPLKYPRQVHQVFSEIPTNNDDIVDVNKADVPGQTGQNQRH